MPINTTSNTEQNELIKAFDCFSDNKVFIFGSEDDETSLKNKIKSLRDFYSEKSPELNPRAGTNSKNETDLKKAFITNSGVHWTVYTTEDGGTSFKKVKIRGDGYCGLTASLYVYDFFQEDANKLKLLSQLQAGDTILSPSGGKQFTQIKVESNSDLEGQYYITSTFESGKRVQQISNDYIAKINEKIPADTNLQRRIQNLSNFRGNTVSHWFDQADVHSFLNHNLDGKVCEEASNGDEIAPLRNTLAMLKSKKARVEFIKKINNEGDNFTIENNFNIEDLFPSVEVQNLATDQNFQQKYLPIFEKLCEKKDSLGNKINDLATKICEFTQIMSEFSPPTNYITNSLGSIKRLFESLFTSTATATPAPTTVAPTITKPQAQEQAEKNIAETKYEELNKPRNLYEFVKKYCGQIDFNTEAKENQQEKVRKILKEKIPDTFQPIPQNKYAGWGLKIEYNKDQIKIVEDFDTSRASSESVAGKIITHIDGKTIAEFIKDQKSYSTILKDGLRQDDIPDEYYLTHFFRTATNDIKLGFNNGTTSYLCQSNKKIYERASQIEINQDNFIDIKGDKEINEEIKEITIEHFKQLPPTFVRRASIQQNEAKTR